MSIRETIHALAILICGTAISSAQFLIDPFKFSVAGATYIVNETFEGAGYASGATWYETGTVNEDFSTAGLSMLGSDCLEIDATAASGETGVFQQWAETSPVYTSFLFRVTALPTTLAAVARLRDGFNNHGTLFILSTGALYVRQGTGTFTATTDTMSVNTTYRVWLEYTKSTGANDGIAKVFFSTDNTKPASGNKVATCSDGNSTADVDGFYLYCDKDGSGQKHYFDGVLVDDVVIGSNP